MKLRIFLLVLCINLGSLLYAVSDEDDWSASKHRELGSYSLIIAAASVIPSPALAAVSATYGMYFLVRGYTGWGLQANDDGSFDPLRKFIVLYTQKYKKRG